MEEDDTLPLAIAACLAIGLALLLAIDGQMIEAVYFGLGGAVLWVLTVIEATRGRLE